MWLINICLQNLIKSWLLFSFEQSQQEPSITHMTSAELHPHPCSSPHRLRFLNVPSFRPHVSQAATKSSPVKLTGDLGFGQQQTQQAIHKGYWNFHFQNEFLKTAFINQISEFMYKEVNILPWLSTPCSQCHISSPLSSQPGGRSCGLKISFTLAAR